MQFQRFWSTFVSPYFNAHFCRQMKLQFILSCGIIILMCCSGLTLVEGAPPKGRNHINDNQLGEDQQEMIRALNPAQNFDNPILGKESQDVKVEDLKPVGQLAKPKKAVKKNPRLVRRPDHLEAVPLERDGHLNKKFRKEVFLGKDTDVKGNDVAFHEMGGVDGANDEHAESNKNKEKPKEKLPEDILVEVFAKADTDGDQELSRNELEEWIFKTAIRHLDEAVEESKIIFKEIDQDYDGVLTWDEYHYHFLTDKKLMSPDKAKRHKEEDHAELEPEDRDTMEAELEKWKEADTDGETGLSQWEFLAFRHPEHSLKMLKNMVFDIVRALDKNNDGRLSEEEFVAPPPGVLENGWEKEEKDFLDDRRREFKEEIDLDHDGFATEDELLEYSNPRNTQHARHEAKELMELADSNEDGKLALKEVLAHKSIFFGSTLLNPSRNLHDEM